MGKGPEYEPSRRFLLHSGVCAADDQARRRPDCEHLFSCRKECASERRCLRRIQMGAERLELLRSRGTASEEYPCFGCMSRICGYGPEWPRRQEPQQNA